MLLLILVIEVILPAPCMSEGTQKLVIYCSVVSNFGSWENSMVFFCMVCKTIFSSFLMFFFFYWSLSLFSTTVFVLSLFGHCCLYMIAFIQSGSQLSVNQEAVDLSVAGLPVDSAETPTSVNPNTDTESILIPSGCTTPSCTPLPLELHIDEDGCSVPMSSAAPTVVMASSQSLKYSKIHHIDDGDSFTTEISHVESLSISSTIMPLSQTEVSTPTTVSISKVSASQVSSSPNKSSSPIFVEESCIPEDTGKRYNLVAIPKSSSQQTAPVNPGPILEVKSPSPPDPNGSSRVQSQSPVPKSDSSVLVCQSPKLKTASPVTVPRLSSPVPKSVSPVEVPNISSQITPPNSSSPETVPKSASPVSFPRLSSPVTKTASPVVGPNACDSASVPKYSSPQTLPTNAGPVILPRLSSPVLVTTSDTVVKSPASVTRKTYTVAGTSSPTVSPVPLAALQSHSLSPPASGKQGGETLDLIRPCRDPFLDDALDELLSPNPTQLSEDQPPDSEIPGDENRSWEEEEEDGIYPDLSREGTLTPMTESSWIDECFTPSTCPGTPDATLDLPTQQPSAVERLSASGQVGRSTSLSQNKLLA